MERQADIAAKQVVEIEFWKTFDGESPQSFSIYNIINKASEAQVLLDCFGKYGQILSNGGRVLEMGGGQGWASCVYKCLFPKVHITTTDISRYAVEGLPHWERVFNVKVDSSYACTSYETREPPNSVDLVFCFAAAHHFLAHRRTLRELARILKPSGKALYFYEPTTPAFFYKVAYWRVNRKRPEVPEDVLRVASLKKMAKDFGLELKVDYYTSLIKRGRFETVYYWVLGRLPLLQRLLPCSANLVFSKTQG